jgi:pimeloyl-ACP methyl ester carboxylesterase
MPTANVNGVRIFYELNGTGDALVLGHGSWVSHHSWDPVAPRLADSFRVLTYDRRGHSESERPTGQGSVREDVTDLATLIEHLGLVPAWVTGNSFGASITLRMAGERPDLFRGLLGHEPPLFWLLAHDPAVAPMLEELDQRIAAVVEGTPPATMPAPPNSSSKLRLGPACGLSCRPSSSRLSSRTHQPFSMRRTIQSSLPSTSNELEGSLSQPSSHSAGKAPRPSRL